MTQLNQHIIVFLQQPLVFLLLFLFSVLVGLAAELVNEKRANAKKTENNAEGDTK